MPYIDNANLAPEFQIKHDFQPISTMWTEISSKRKKLELAHFAETNMWIKSIFNLSKQAHRKSERKRQRMHNLISRTPNSNAIHDIIQQSFLNIRKPPFFVLTSALFPKMGFCLFRSVSSVKQTKNDLRIRPKSAIIFQFALLALTCERDQEISFHIHLNSIKANKTKISGINFKRINTGSI